jgi:hypothetical protein
MLQNKLPPPLAVALNDCTLKARSCHLLVEVGCRYLPLPSAFLKKPSYLTPPIDPSGKNRPVDPSPPFP